MSPEVIQHFTDKEFYPGPVLSADCDYDQRVITIAAENDVVLQLYVINDYILRFRYSPDGYFPPDFSYGLSDSYNTSPKIFTFEENKNAYLIRTAHLDCEVSKINMAVKIMDKSGDVLNEDEKGFHWEVNQKHGGYIVQMTKKVQNREVFYGLGDKPTDLNLKGKRFMNWGTDHYGYSKNSDPLYKNIPVYYGLHDGKAYGIFFDNSFRSYFDFGSERNAATSFWAQGGEMNYYFIAGPSLLEVSERYTLLTGTPEMPPLWALGFQQCKWSYFPESNVMDVASKMRSLNIPCDAIYLDIDYMDGFRCFTWDLERFPDPKSMISRLKKIGFKTMVIIDPGIKIDKEYSVFQEGLEKGYFCRRPDGPFVVGKVWPGDCYFPDFTRAEVRDWWAGLYKELIEDLEVDGVWNDMNEPALFEVESKTFPEDVMHDHDGHMCSHRKAHNVYGMQMARATAEGVKRFSGNKRSLIITRSGYAGMQRYSSVWTGDNIATWEHLWLADVQVQRLSISGVSFCGSDIGGFIGQPTGELFVRWIQLGIFHPFCRVHSSGDHGDQEPWSFGEKYTKLFRKAVELRYQLLPYIYTSFYHYHKKGTPMIRPIAFYDQEDSNNFDRDHEFLCGPDILVVPVMHDSAQSRRMYLPSGNWYNYWNKKLTEGKQELSVPINLDSFPCYIKAGAIIPHFPIQQYVGEKSIEEVRLNCYYLKGKYNSEWYDDAHDGMEYEENQFRLCKFEQEGTVNSVTITQAIEGEYESAVSQYKLELVGHPFTISNVIVDGNELHIDDSENIIIPANFKKCIIS